MSRRNEAELAEYRRRFLAENGVLSLTFLDPCGSGRKVSELCLPHELPSALASLRTFGVGLILIETAVDPSDA